VVNLVVAGLVSNEVLHGFFSNRWRNGARVALMWCAQYHNAKASQRG